MATITRRQQMVPRRTLLGVAVGASSIIGAPALSTTRPAWTEPDTSDGRLIRRAREDATAALRLATSDAAPYSLSLHRAVHLPEGTIALPGRSGSIHIRKGQTLAGAGLGATTLDLSGKINDHTPGLRLGRSENGALDPGGQAVEVAEMTILGGPSSYGAVDTDAVAGWKVRDVFFSGPGIGVAAGGGDGLLTGCIFDMGLTHISTRSLGNTVFSNNLHYEGNHQVALRSNTHDVTFVGNQYEYFRYSGILFDLGQENIRNVAIVGCNFVQNEQHETTLGAIYISSHSSEISVYTSRFRNIAGFAIAYGTGVGNKLIVESCSFDGRRTSENYHNSSTMGGVNASNMAATIRNSSFHNLPGQPIIFGGQEESVLIVQACDFRGNTGGSSEIRIENTNPRSRVYILGCISEGRPLVNNQSIVPVRIVGSIDATV